MNVSNPASEQDLFDRLDALGITHKTHRHPPLHTVEESQAARAALPDLPPGHCKNLFLKDKKGVFWLFVTFEDTRVNMKALQLTLGAARLSFVRAELMKEYLGVEPGSVTPFAAINPASLKVQFVLDAAMLKSETLNYHPLHNAATTTVTPADLQRFLIDCGHQPRVVNIEEP